MTKSSKILTIIYSVLMVVDVIYVSFPNPNFPSPPPGALQSNEPADTETPFRRAYFTDFTRDEVMSFYKLQFNSFPTLELNYPPEEAQTIIRDQARSTFLEELSHPFRESLYVNGFEPKEAKDEIIVNQTHFRQKITVRYVPSSRSVRVVVVFLTGVVGVLLISQIDNVLRNSGFLVKLLNKK